MTTERLATVRVVIRRFAARAGHDPGRRLRVLTGVDEQLLAWVPSERPRYTALGGVVLGTAVIAALSMWNALSAVMGGAHLWLIVPVLVWMLFILNLDRWLVSTSAGVQWRRRLAVLLPRLVVAFFFGVIIAEPLVLQIFHTAVVQHIRDQREEQLATLRTELVRCNPSPERSAAPAAVTPTGCAGKILSFTGTPAGVAEELTAMRTDAQALQKTIDDEAAELDRLNELARNECAGRSGAGFTGRVGQGPNCQRLRGEADDFAAANPPQTARLAGLRAQISELEGQFRAGTEGFERLRADQVTVRVAEMAAHQGPIGLLERLRALDELTRENPFLFLATWLVRVFFILIDCLPVLVKFFAGATAYDRLTDEKVTSAGRLFARTVKTDENRRMQDLDLDDYASRLDGDKRREDLDLAARRHAATVRADLDHEVERLAYTLRSRPRPETAPARSDGEPLIQQRPRNGAGGRHAASGTARHTNGTTI